MSEPELDQPERWQLPEGVQVAPEVNLDEADPALVDAPWLNGKQAGARRRCVVVRVDGARCGGMASPAGLLCTIHDGRADPSQAALARAVSVQKRAAAADAVLSLQKLGTRAVIAQTFSEQATKVQKAVTLLLDAASAGDLGAAKALIPYLDQALGRPQERVQVSTPSTPEELKAMEDGELEALVAEGRRARLELVQGVPEQENDRA